LSIGRDAGNRGPQQSQHTDFGWVGIPTRNLVVTATTTQRRLFTDPIVRARTPPSTIVDCAINCLTFTAISPPNFTCQHRDIAIPQQTDILLSNIYTYLSSPVTPSFLLQPSQSFLPASTHHSRPSGVGCVFFLSSISQPSTFPTSTITATTTITAPGAEQHNKPTGYPILPCDSRSPPIPHTRARAQPAIPTADSANERTSATTRTTHTSLIPSVLHCKPVQQGFLRKS